MARNEITLSDFANQFTAYLNYFKMHVSRRNINISRFNFHMILSSHNISSSNSI